MVYPEVDLCIFDWTPEPYEYLEESLEAQETPPGRSSSFQLCDDDGKIPIDWFPVIDRRLQGRYPS